MLNRIDNKFTSTNFSLSIMLTNITLKNEGIKSRYLSYRKDINLQNVPIHKYIFIS